MKKKVIKRVNSKKVKISRDEKQPREGWEDGFKKTIKNKVRKNSTIIIPIDSNWDDREWKW